MTDAEKETLEWAASLNELNNGGTKIATLGDAIRTVLKEVERLRNESERQDDRAWAILGWLFRDRDRLEARLKAALALHTKEGINQGGLPYIQCRLCGGGLWPCSTVKALKGRYDE